MRSVFLWIASKSKSNVIVPHFLLLLFTASIQGSTSAASPEPLRSPG